MTKSTRKAFEDIRSGKPDVEGLSERPVIVLTEQIIYPGIFAAIPISSQNNLEAVRLALESNQTIIAVASQKKMDNESSGTEHLYSIGTEIALGHITNNADGETIVMVQGINRVKIDTFVQGDSSIMAKAQLLPDRPITPDKMETLSSAVLDLFKHSIEMNDTIPNSVADYTEAISQPGELADLIASTLPFVKDDQQQILEMVDIKERLEYVALVMAKTLSTQEIQEEVEGHIQQEMARTQRELYLREQMRIIQSELGEGDVFQQELQDLQEQVMTANFPTEVQNKSLKELSRLSSMAPIAPESGVIRTYLDWLLALPWQKYSEDNLDIHHAETVLDEVHYGLEKIKDRILEHIAVRNLAADKMKTPILCFVGPPGVGKTSIGKSIAKALGRKFIRMSLGGIQDEAEIRGHRRTYIGALPGRIIQAIRRAETTNPVFMLDEIDKLSSDFRGDPAAALLEALDPEQNHEFVDHYLEVAYDLSNVLFITTANTLYPIPPALEDRMEVIEFTGYSEEDKIAIARKFLIPKQLEANGIHDKKIIFHTGALQTLIREYTYESGVRNLEREIANVCRKIARLVAADKKYPKRITSKRISEYLGPPQFLLSRANEEDSVGVVTGLVWTPSGGDIQTIEISIIPGKGSVTLTGQLGEVLQESAQAALSYLRTRALDLNIPHDDFENYDIHVHMPEGAVPKDGPSAGITLATSLISAFTEQKIRSDYAMTGEITLRGNILPIGGVKEKVLAARRHRIPNVILPSDNQRDLTDIPKQVLRDLNIVFVKNMQEVLDLVLLEAPEQRKRDIHLIDEEDPKQDKSPEGISKRELSASEL